METDVISFSGIVVLPMRECALLFDCCAVLPLSVDVVITIRTNDAQPGYLAGELMQEVRRPMLQDRSTERR